MIVIDGLPIKKWVDLSIRHRTTIATANLATWSGEGSREGAMSPPCECRKKRLMESYVEFMCISVYIYIYTLLYIYIYIYRLYSYIIIYH